MLRSSQIDIVPKISKHCNLRCTYCYEYRELADRRRMGLDRIGRMFDTLRRYTDQNQAVRSLRFAWQGGEPMLIKPDVYQTIAARCAEAFAGSSVAVTHVVQTNLTALSPAWLDFLRDGGVFSDVGISFDVVGDRRVDTRGRVTTDTVLANMQALIDARIPFAAIAVVSRFTLAGLGDVYRFFNTVGLDVRFLPFNQSISDEQFADHALSPSEVTQALCDLFDLWMTSDRVTTVEPLNEYLRYALYHIARPGSECGAAPIDARESVFVVNTDGAVWGTADLYAPGKSYGNIFEEEFADILAAPMRAEAAGAMRRRVDAHCRACPYFGACPGYGVAFSMPEERAALDRHGCTVRAVIGHIVGRIEEVGLAEALRRTDGGGPSSGGALASPL